MLECLQILFVADQDRDVAAIAHLDDYGVTLLCKGRSGDQGKKCDKGYI